MRENPVSSFDPVDDEGVILSPSKDQGESNVLILSLSKDEGNEFRF